MPLSTKDVFTHFTGPKSGFAGSLSHLDAAGMVELGNDLTATAIELAPAINNCLDRLAGSKGAIAPRPCREAGQAVLRCLIISTMPKLPPDNFKMPDIGRAPA